MDRSQSRTGKRTRGTPTKAARHSRRARKPAEYRGGTWGYAMAERLRELVRHSGGVRRFAEQVGVSASLVSSYLSGKRLPDSLSLRKIVEGTSVSLDWLLFGAGGDSPVMRGQSRPEATLADDVAAHVGREAAQLVSVPFPGAEVRVNGEHLLRAAAQRVARNYQAWASRVMATAAALMPVTELAIEWEQLAERTARDLKASDAAYWREHARKRADRAFSAVYGLPYTLEQGASGSPFRLSVDPGAYFPILSEAHHQALVERASRDAARPFIPPGGSGAR